MKHVPGFFVTACLALGVSCGDDSGSATGSPTTAGCPAAPPEDDSTCNPDQAASECRYTGIACTCGGMGSGDEWNCEGDGAECPLTPPQDGTACDPGGAGGNGPGGGLQCPYPTVDCTCSGFGQSADEWNCTAVTPCTSAPNDGDPCTGTGFCEGCACFDDQWTCFGGEGGAPGGGFGGGPGFP